MMLQCLYFNFMPFGLKNWVSSLQEYFNYKCVKEEVLSSFACLDSKIAEDTALGLQYLREVNLVQRDLKLGNMLISNQQYCHLRSWIKFEKPGKRKLPFANW